MDFYKNVNKTSEIGIYLNKDWKVGVWVLSVPYTRASLDCLVHYCHSPEGSPHCSSKDCTGTAGQIYKMCLKMQIRSQRDFSRQFIKPGCESPLEANGSKAWNLSRCFS